MVNLNFGEYVRKRRLALYSTDRKYSVRQVAARMGIEPSYLSKVERVAGNTLSEEKTIALARELNEDPDFLLALSGKISSDVMTEIRRRPMLFARLVRDLKDLPDHRIQADRTYRYLEDRLALAESMASIGVWERNLRTEEDFWSDELFRLLGYAPNAVPPSYETFMLHVGFNDAQTAVGQKRLLHGPTLMDVEVEIATATGETRRGHWRVDVERDASGIPIRCIGSLHDITPDKDEQTHIAALVATERELRAALASKELVLHEMHHRVKNDLQIISSLLQMTARRSTAPGVDATIRDIKAKIETMALIHTQLFRQDHLDNIDIGSFAAGLLHRLHELFGHDSQAVESVLHVEQVPLPVDQAIHCGLFLNEAVTNVYKHAFPNGEKGKIFLHIASPGPGLARVCVGDNGVGLHHGATSDSRLGMKLIHTLAQQLGATLDITGRQGTRLELSFPINSARSLYGQHQE